MERTVYLPLTGAEIEVVQRALAGLDNPQAVGIQDTLKGLLVEEALISEGDLLCPICGEVNEFRIVEDACTFHGVEGFDAVKKIIRARAGDSMFSDCEEHENYRLCCNKCLHEFALPEGVEIRWNESRKEL